MWYIFIHLVLQQTQQTSLSAACSILMKMVNDQWVHGKTVLSTTKTHSLQQYRHSVLHIP